MLLKDQIAKLVPASLLPSVEPLLDLGLVYNLFNECEVDEVIRLIDKLQREIKCQKFSAARKTVHCLEGLLATKGFVAAPLVSALLTDYELRIAVKNMKKYFCAVVKLTSLCPSTNVAFNAIDELVKTFIYSILLTVYFVNIKNYIENKA